jgi:hypothetical protein
MSAPAATSTRPAAPATSSVDKVCAQCSKRASLDHRLSKCARCNLAYYCGRGCQRAHWPEHREACTLIFKAKKKEAKEPDEFSRRLLEASRDLVSTAIDKLFDSDGKDDTNVEASLLGALESVQRSFGIKGHEDALQRLLTKGAYVEVYSYVASEKDTACKISWLKENANKGHVMLFSMLLQQLFALAKKEHPDNNFPKEIQVELLSYFLTYSNV